MPLDPSLPSAGQPLRSFVRIRVQEEKFEVGEPKLHSLAAVNSRQGRQEKKKDISVASNRQLSNQ